MQNASVTLYVYGAIRKYFTDVLIEIPIEADSASLAEVIFKVREKSVEGFNRIWDSDRKWFARDIVCFHKNKRITDPQMRLKTGEILKVLQHAPGG